MTGMPLKILILATNPDTARAVRESLTDTEQTSYTLLDAASVVEAIEHLAQQTVSLILLEQDVAEERGIELFQAIHDRFPEVPKIVLTEASAEGAAIRAVAQGAADYILIPQITAEKLNSRITAVIEQERQTPDGQAALSNSKSALWQACCNMIDFSPRPSIMLDDEGHIIYLNSSAAAYLGNQPEEKLDDLIDFRLADRGVKRITWLQQLARSRENLNWTELTGGDTVRYALSWGVPEENEESGSDRSTADLSTRMLNHMAEAVIGTDHTDRIIYMNGVAEFFTEYSIDEAVGELLSDVFKMMVREDHSDCNVVLQHVHNTSSPFLLPRDTLVVGKKETTRFIAGSATAIEDNKGDYAGMVLVFRDVSDRRQIGENLRKADKLESVGLLAGGIAHDYNNLLTGILGNISLVKLLVKADPRARKHLAQAEKALLRSRELTQQLLTFSKGGSPVKEVATIQEIVEESAGFALSGANVKMDFWAAEDLKAVEVDRGQIGQVIHNLVINAVQAMPDGGDLEVKLSNYYAFGNSLPDIAPGDYVRIMVRDSGKGISPENLEKIFDPYFTTRKSGNGLGLAICYSIIRKHDGLMTVVSELGKGTQFDIYLPISEKHIEEEANSGSEIKNGHEKILVIDDEVILVETANDLLEFLGYEVQTALNSRDAFELFEKACAESTPFDVVLLDLTLPGDLGGEEILQGLKAIDPKVRAIVSSGYSTSTIMSEYASHGFAGMVSKPYSVEELSEELQRVIHRD